MRLENTFTHTHTHTYTHKEIREKRYFFLLKKNETGHWVFSLLQKHCCDASEQNQVPARDSQNIVDAVAAAAHHSHVQSYIKWCDDDK